MSVREHLDIVKDYEDNFIKPYPTDGLILEYTGELDGSTLLDSVGNYSSSVTGTALNTTGKVGHAISFNGTTHYYLGADKSELELYQFSASCWVYLPNTLSANNSIFINYNDGAVRGVSLSVESDRTVRLSTYDGYVNSLLSTSILSINQWYHLTYVFKNSTEALIYIDGTQDATGSLPVPSYHSTTTHFVVFGGVYVSGFTQQFNGYIDQFRLYNRALTPTEISQLYNSGNGV